MEWCYRDVVQHDGRWCRGHSLGDDVKCTVGTMRVSCLFLSLKGDAVFAVIGSGKVFQCSRLSDASLRENMN